MSTFFSYVNRTHVYLFVSSLNRTDVCLFLFVQIGPMSAFFSLCKLDLCLPFYSNANRAYVYTFDTNVNRTNVYLALSCKLELCQLFGSNVNRTQVYFFPLCKLDLGLLFWLKYKWVQCKLDKPLPVSVWCKLDLCFYFLSLVQTGHVSTFSILV